MHQMLKNLAVNGPQPIGGTIYKAYVMGINGICQAGEIDVLFLFK